MPTLGVLHGRAPPVDTNIPACFGQPAPIRRPHGAQRDLLTVASSRTWRVSQASAA